MPGSPVTSTMPRRARYLIRASTVPSAGRRGRRVSRRRWGGGDRRRVTALVNTLRRACSDWRDRARSRSFLALEELPAVPFVMAQGLGRVAEVRERADEGGHGPRPRTGRRRRGGAWPSARSVAAPWRRVSYRRGSRRAPGAAARAFRRAPLLEAEAGGQVQPVDELPAEEGGRPPRGLRWWRGRARGQCASRPTRRAFGADLHVLALRGEVRLRGAGGAWRASSGGAARAGRPARPQSRSQRALAAAAARRACPRGTRRGPGPCVRRARPHGPSVCERSRARRAAGSRASWAILALESASSARLRRAAAPSVPRALLACFEDQVERNGWPRRGGTARKPPRVATSRRRASPAWAPRASPTLLGPRRGRADERGGGVIHAADRIEVASTLSPANGSTIIHVPSAARRCADVRRRPTRVAHVVQAVERRTRS